MADFLGRGWTLGAGLRYEEEIPHSNEFMAVTAVYNAQVMHGQLGR